MRCMVLHVIPTRVSGRKLRVLKWGRSAGGEPATEPRLAFFYLLQHVPAVATLLRNVEFADENVSIDQFAICLTVAVCAAFVFFLKRARIRRSIRVPGTVLEHLRVECSNGKRDWVSLHLRISYRIASGQWTEFESSTSPSPPPKVGETLTVVYDPKDPSEVRIEDYKFRHWQECLVFVVSMFGVWMYIYERLAR